MDVNSTTQEKVKINLAPNHNGKPLPVDGVPIWTLDGTGSIEPAADGLSAYVISADQPGESTWGVEADADLGAGVTTIRDGGKYTYIDPQASSLGTTSNPPEPK